MKFNDLLQMVKIGPNDVAVLFHVSDKPALHRALPMLAEEEPNLFDAVQNQHGPKVEAMIRKRRYLASFVNTGDKDYCFVGLFEVMGSRFQSMQELDADPRRAELRRRFDTRSYVAHGQSKGLPGRLVFDLTPRPELGGLIGRLFVAKPGGRAFARLAENLDCTVVEITRERRLVPPAPDWNQFVVTGEGMRDLPRDWQARLREWRGIYLIVDQKDCKQYVGSAYGETNLLGRWRAHVARDAGVTVELGKRDPAGFRFSILELLAPSAPIEAVTELETSWKHRLGTKICGLNRN